MMAHDLFAAISAEGIKSFLTNLTTITQSAEDTFVVLSTFISTGIGGVLLAVKQVRKRMNSVEGSPAAPVTQAQLTHIEDLLKQEHTDIESLQKNLDFRCTTLENDISTLRTDLLNGKKDSK